MGNLSRRFYVFAVGIVLILCLSDYGHCQTTRPKDKPPSEIQNRVARLRPFGYPDTLKDLYFYGIHDLACSEDGRLFLVDQQTSSIRVFNLESEAELYRIGKAGGGPGEFRQIARIRILSSGKLAVIDNRLHRCSFFDLGGKLERTVPLLHQVDDLDSISKDSLVLSSFLFDATFKPLAIFNVKSEKLNEAFGQIIDPRPGLLGLFDKYAGIVGRDIYSMYSVMTKVLFLPGTYKCVYAQKNPYSLVLYDLENHKGSRFEVAAPFDTGDDIQLKVEEKRVHIGGPPPQGVALAPTLVEGRIVVPVFGKGGKENYIDVYDKDTRHVQRLRVPPLEKDVRPFKVCFYHSQMLLLVSGPALINWVERMEVRLPETESLWRLK